MTLSTERGALQPIGQCRIKSLAGASQTLALHMKAHPAWAGRAVKPRSRKAVREAQGLTARTSPKPSSQNS